MRWWFSDYDPFEEIERMRKSLDRLTRRMLSGFWEPFEEEETFVEPRRQRFFGFPVDISEVGDEIVIRADLPGFDKENINIRITEDTVEIVGMRKEERKESGENFFRAERKMGAVKRVLSLPVKVDPDTAKAEMKNGILEIRVKKKAEEKKYREVKVE